jgi:hypothetical protein
MCAIQKAWKASRSTDFVLALCLWAACYVVAAAPVACAQDQYALEVGGATATVTIDDSQDALRLGCYTYELWLKDLQGPTGSWRNVFCKGLGNSATGRGPLLALRPSEPGVHYDHCTGTTQSTLNAMEGIVANEWVHVALVLTALDGQQRIYLNGEQAVERTSAGLTADTQEPVLRMGLGARVVLDDFRVWNYARTAEEIQAGMGQELRGSEEGLVGYWKFNEGEGTTAADSSPSQNHGTITGPLWREDIAPIAFGPAPAYAYGQSPADGAVDVPHDVVLGWKPGESADTHDVYFGTAFGDVSEASRTDPRGVLVGQGQATTTYSTAGEPLQYGQTYYWRVDELSAPPDGTIFTGDVWSFTVEPFGYPITQVTATASSAQPGMGPQNTVNGSGLNAGDEHSTELTQMWTSSGTPPNWIQYEFDAPYKLHELWVWNSNQMIESFVGFGARDVAIEYSVDGVAWTALDGVPEFAKATGSPTYTANTTIPFGGVTARYVKLTIESNWGGVAPQTGLSEVRFFSIPVRAREPQPADGATGISLDAELDWRPGREAQSHNVYFGADRAAVAEGSALAATVAEHGYAPGALEFGTTYYWKVDEVDDAAAYPGEVWGFTTQEYAIVEDFESYNDDDNRIYDTWVDGWVNNTGSQVGYDVSPFAEKRIVHAGRQSMPFSFNNEESPFYSEAEREFATAQNWTLNGADTLSLWTQDAPANLYVTVQDSAGK